MSAPGKEESALVLIHGLWMHGTVMRLLASRLEGRTDSRLLTYSYPSVSAGIDENVALLGEYLKGLDAARIDLVGHSLGGVIALRTALEIQPSAIGRIVCLGAPLVGSSAARALQSWPGGAAIMGHAIREAVLDAPLKQWPGTPEAGMIAGDLGMGAGLLLNALDGEHDGTVSVDETRLPGLTDHIVLPVSHTGLLLSVDVADQAAAFLRDGAFVRGD